MKRFIDFFINAVMKNSRLFLFIFLLSGFPCLLVAQHSLQKETTETRAGDEFVKTEMNFFPVEKEKDTGKKEKKNWNFSKLKEKEKVKTYKLKIKRGTEVEETTVEEILPDYTVVNFEDARGNMVTGENNTLVQRHFSGDSLLETGYENPNQRVCYLEPLLVMKFPMELGMEYQSEFTGRGAKDDRIASLHYGNVTTSIDAFGDLVLPGGDTLTSIVRVHETKVERINYEPLTGLFDITAPVDRDSLEKLDAPDDLITTDTYLWYEEGYRYPVFETVQSYRILKDKTLPLREATYVYAPYEQEFLKKDPENEKIKKEKKEKVNPIEPLEYSFSPNPVTSVLNLKVKTQKGAETTVGIYEFSGREVWSKVYPATNGNNSETIQMGSWRTGTYILRISCGDEYAAEKILKL